MSRVREIKPILKSVGVYLGWYILLFLIIVLIAAIIAAIKLFVVYG